MAERIEYFTSMGNPLQCFAERWLYVSHLSKIAGYDRVRIRSKLGVERQLHRGPDQRRSCLDASYLVRGRCLSGVCEEIWRVQKDWVLPLYANRHHWELCHVKGRARLKTSTRVSQVSIGYHQKLYITWVINNKQCLYFIVWTTLTQLKRNMTLWLILFYYNKNYLNSIVWTTLTQSKRNMAP